MNTEDKPLIDVTVYVWGDGLDPATISSCLGVEPSLARRKGDKRISAGQREITARTGLWTLDASNSENISTRIQELGQKLDYRARQVNAIAGVQGAYVDIYIAVSAQNDGGGQHKFSLSPQDVDALQKIGLPVEFTLDVVKE